MEKSFGELLTDSISVFKKSFLATLAIVGMFLGLCGVFGLMAVFIIGPQIISNINSIDKILPYLSTFLVIFAVLFVLYYICYCWVLLVIRNNALVGKSFLKETFLEAIRKIWKLFLAGILMTLVFVIIGAIGFLIADKYVALIMLPLVLIITPALFTVFYGVLYREGGFWEIVTESFFLGFEKWFRIVGYMFLFMLCFMAVATTLMGVPSYLFRLIDSQLAAVILNMLVQVVLMLFSFCFTTVFYLDLAGIRPLSEIALEQNLQEQITQTNQNML